MCVSQKSRVRGVIFDMDGTLTVPVIDFAAMRRRLDIPEGDILHTIHHWSLERQAVAFDIIEEIEAEARDRLELQQGAIELLSFIDQQKLPKAILTRNTLTSVTHLMERNGFHFDTVITRDFKPYKPAPDAVIFICRSWNIPPSDVLLVGDYRDDIVCGQAAGVQTCLLLSSTNRTYRELAQHAMESLHDIIAIIRAGVADQR